jgi:uncharacterized membrane protein HdeD (DUF308 family)
MPQDFLDEDLGLFAGRWWTVLLRGITAVMFGVLAFAWPAITLAMLVLLFGYYALTDGIFSLLAAAGGRHREDRWVLALEGIVGVWAGVVTLRAPHVIASVLIFFLSFWAMATGFLRLAAAFRLRREVAGEHWLAASGILSVAFALMLLVRPAVGAVGLVWILAGYAVVLGVVLIILGMELRGVQASHAHGVSSHHIAHKPV